MCVCVCMCGSGDAGDASMGLGRPRGACGQLSWLDKRRERVGVHGRESRRPGEGRGELPPSDESRARRASGSPHWACERARPNSPPAARGHGTRWNAE